MTTRRLIMIAAVLLVAAGAVQVLLWWLRPQHPERMQAGPPRSGYTLQHFTLSGYGPDGALTYRLQAPRLNRREGDESLYLDQPRFLLPPKDKDTSLPWTGRSEYGWVSAKGDELKLQGPVHMQRPAFKGSAAARIDTRDVTAWPPQNRIATDAHVAIRQGTATMSGTGMRAQLDTKHLELLHDIHGTFKPGTQAH